MRKVIATLLLFLCVAVASAAARWESVNAAGRQAPPTERLTDGSDAGVDVTVSEGYIYVTCTRPTAVKVFTILGQLVSQETLPAGTHRLRMSSKGIYILKVADQTRRVTI